jgi:hypothetical protein
MMRLESEPTANTKPARRSRVAAAVARWAQRILAAALIFPSAAIRAQGVTTAGIRGSVRDALGHAVDATVRVREIATGFSADVRAAHGRFLIQGLEPGGPYVVTARALGFAPQQRDAIVLTLGELREINFQMQPVAARMDTVTVAAPTSSLDRAHPGGGIGTLISESQLEHLPTLNRDLYDFLRLVPQISTKISLSSPAISAAGQNFRFNEFLINGVSERTLSGGVSNAFGGSKSVPLDAVKEYEVLLAPYDVRYGDFSGALVNTVTKSGTNAIQGSAFAFGRNDRLARRSGPTVAAPYDRAQYGLSLGGPIVPNRLHFFVASELQRFTSPAAGPYVGQPASADRPVPVSAADLDRFDAIMRGYGLTAGSAGPVENGNPLRNLFTRLDLALPSWSSRVIAWNNYSSSANTAFSRAARDTFSLASFQTTNLTQTRTTAVQLHTTLPRAGGGHNELLISNRTDGFDPVPAVQQPVVRVSVPTVSGARITLNSGTPPAAQATALRPSAFTVSDNVTLPLRSTHVVTLGADVERFSMSRQSVGGSYGAWSFLSLDALQAGVADRYDERIDVGGGSARIVGGQYAAYVGDAWQATERFSLSGGLRADMLAIDSHAPYQPLVDSIFGRRTDETPPHRIELSPRLGFTWNVSHAAHQQFRGGMGIFTSSYPLAWPQTALASYGAGGLLHCSRASAALPAPPPFVPDYRSAPTACAGAAVTKSPFAGDVDLLDKNLRMMRVARGSLAYELGLPWDLTMTNEALVTRGLSDFVLRNLNLPEPAATDPYGRVMYGTINANGAAALKPRSPFSEVIDLRNVAGNYSYQYSTRLEKRAVTGLRGSLSYTYSRARDAQTPLRVNTTGLAAWSIARVTSGRDDDLTIGTSANDVPHRVIVSGTYATTSPRWRTQLSFYYVGESGRPFTYIAFGALGRGDLNADGSNANDPIYVPRNALDTLEIRFSGLSDSAGADNSTATQAKRQAAERAAFQGFIEGSPCLRQQRGQILARNSCREPWSNTTIASVRQAIPAAGHFVEVELEAQNVLNLLNADWGFQREAAPALLEHVGQTGDAPQTSRPIFRFTSTNVGWTTNPDASAFQLQLALRYRF